MSLLPVEDARARILHGVEPLEAEPVTLGDALRRILAADIEARLDQPPFDASAMDGYAVRSKDVASVPTELEVIGSSAAGAGFHGSVGTGQAVRIFTGAPVPEGADTIVIQENARADAGRVVVLESAPSGQFIRRRALDFARGEVLLKAGTRLGPREIALAAAMNHASLPVRRRPRIAILATGDELVEPGSVPGPDQIVSSNNHGLAAFVAMAGGEPVDLGIAADTPDALAGAIRRAQGCDVLITLGGASVGEHDLVQAALVAAGVKLDFWRIAMRPGKPLMFGRRGPLRALGLPGNPVSALVCSMVFLKPLIDAYLGHATSDGEEEACLGRDLAANDQRQDYLRATLKNGADGARIATPFERQDSSMLRTLTQAHCLVVRPPFDPPRKVGDPVRILPLKI